MYCSKCGERLKDGEDFCSSCGTRVSGATNTVEGAATSNNVVRFLLTFFLGFIGSIIINYTSLKPLGWRSRSWAYFGFGILTFGIYPLVAAICNLVFNPNNSSNIGYLQD